MLQQRRIIMFIFDKREVLGRFLLDFLTTKSSRVINRVSTEN